MATDMNPETGGTARPERSPSGDAASAGAGDGSRSYQAPAPESLRLAYMPRRDRALEERTGDSLGWLSIGLGVAALLAPRTLGRSIGMPNSAAIVRGVGVRELVSGAGLLTQKDRTLWLWSRVVGDAMDLALLGYAARPRNPLRGRALGALAVVSSIAAVDLAASVHHTRRRREGGEPLTGGHEAFVERALIVKSHRRSAMRTGAISQICRASCGWFNRSP